MRTRDEIVPDQAVLRPHDPSENLLQRFSSPVAVAVAGRGGKMRLTHPLGDEGRQHLELIIAGDLLHFGQHGRDLLPRLSVEGAEGFGYVKKIQIDLSCSVFMVNI